jgi:hypothetical protein
MYLFLAIVQLATISVGPFLEASPYRARASRGEPISVHRSAASLIGQSPVPPRTFQYDVIRPKTMQKDEAGQLRIDDSGIHFRSTNGKTSITVPFIDVREMDVADPSVVRIETYEMLKRKLSGRRSHIFRLRSPRSAEDNDRLAQFLSERVRRPLLTSRSVGSTPEFEIAAYHRHTLNGCNGTLHITPDGIRFQSTREDHSRTWMYPDIQTFGGSDPFSFRVTTLAETFTFDLKDRLPQEAYDLVWQRVYDLRPRYSTAVKP